MISPERLSALSRHTGFRELALEKVLRLLALLADLNRQPLLSRVLVLKGGTALPHPLHSYLGHLTPRLTPQQVRDQLHPMLFQDQEPRVEKLIQIAWPLVEPLLQLTPAEQEYVDRLQRGELLPELLFPEDPELAERVRRHPVLQWKAQNAATRR